MAQVGVSRNVRLFLSFLILAVLPAAGHRGAEIYTQHCASCHGDQGQGVADKYDEALIGERSIASLARYIHRTMPEDDEDAVIDEDAHLVAEYIHQAFYSPQAQAKSRPVRLDLLRLTHHQHRRAITDLVQSFRGRAWMGPENGLTGQYFHKELMNDRKKELAKRLDPSIDFSTEQAQDIPDLDPEAHAIFWNGSLLPPETGTYSFRLRTPNGVHFFLNDPQRRKPPLIDALVSSNNEMRSLETSLFLLGGHPVSLSVHFICYQEKKSSLTIEWKPPHGPWQPLPTHVLFPDYSPTATLISTPFPPDDASLGYERGSSISKAWQNAVAKAAIEATSQIHADLDRLARTKIDDPDRRQKIQKFCADFAFRAFARPLTATQQETYLDAIFQEAGDDLDTAVKRSLMLILTSPYFLYPSLNLDQNGQPDHFTAAAHYARALWDSLPDPKHLEAAAQGHFNDPEKVNQHLWSMLSDQRAKVKMSRFFHHWLNLTEKNDLTKDPELFPDFDSQMIADLRTSLDLFLHEVVWSEKSDYRQFFNDNRLYLNPRLATFYQAETSDSPDFVPLVPTDGPRAGLFTHPYLLTAFSYHRQTSPIHRGVAFSRNVLGRFLKPPPNAIEFKDSDFQPNLTMREKVTHLTKDQSCMNCHVIINPVGFSLENYDAIGRFRTHENEQKINSVSDYLDEEEKSIRLAGPSDLAKLAIESPHAHRAFIKHLFHHLIQQPLNAYGFDQIDHLHQSFTNSQFHIRQLIITITRETSPLRLSAE